jgi:hypothetical protein
MLKSNILAQCIHYFLIPHSFDCTGNASHYNSIMTEVWARELAIDGIDSTKETEQVPERKTIQEIYQRMGETGFKQMYSMNYPSFLKLTQVLEESFVSSGGGENHSIGICLAVAIRCFRGGAPFEVSYNHGLTESEAFKCVGIITDAINLFFEENKIKIKKGSAMIQKVRKLVRSHLY